MKIYAKSKLEIGEGMVDTLGASLDFDFVCVCIFLLQPILCLYLPPSDSFPFVA